MKKILKFVDAISEWTGKIASWSSVVIVIIVCGEVIARKFFNHPTIWGFEVTKQLYTFLFLMVAAFTLLHNAHVGVDVLCVKFSKRTNAILAVINYILFFFPFILVLIYEGTKFAADSWATHETTMDVLAAPLYPIKTVIPVAFLLLLIQGCVNFIRSLHIATKGEEL